MSAAAKLLDRLNRVKQTRPSQWMAACPCCESRRGRPLSVRESSDGRVLVHAFCGCETEDVLARVGLELGDLFDQPLTHAIKPVGPRVAAIDVLTALSHETTVLAEIAQTMLQKAQLDEETWNRLATAARRIGNACDYVNERAK